MRVLFIVRSTLFTVKGGDTVQVEETALELRKMGVEVDIRKTNENMKYVSYDLLHFFNIIRPADMLIHITRSNKPFMVSTILVDYSFYDKEHRGGLPGKIFKYLSADGTEYIKTLYRCLLGRDRLVSVSYLWKGQRRSIKWILGKAKCVLVQAEKEYHDLVKLYSINLPFAIVHNGVDSGLFHAGEPVNREENLVLCVARIEGIKNQYNLIRALNDTAYKLILIGDAAPNQKKYYLRCRQLAGKNVSFIGYLQQQELVSHYARAKVHVLPSRFEVCGLSSLEAAAMGCRVVITDNGYARSYFKDAAFYCDPEEPASILEAVKKAATADNNDGLQQEVINNYTWQRTAEETLSVYKKYIQR